MILTTELTPERPRLQELKTADELLGEDWEVLVHDYDHFVIDSEDGCVASVGKEDTQFFLDLDESEALVLVRKALPELIEYVEYLERVNARLEHRDENMEDLAA